MLAEGFGLFLAGLFFPHLKGAEHWFQKGKHIMEEEVARQILPDGGSFEYSTTYLSFVYDFFLLFKICCDRCDFTYTSELEERLCGACAFIRAIMDKNGNIPNIGDQDSAVLVNFGLDNQENFSSILNTGAILFNNPYFSTGADDLKTCIITGKNVKSDPEREMPENPCIQYFSYSGLSIIRDYWDREEILFCGNATPMGLAPLYAHGHLDALSFTLNFGGHEFFVDPGTYCYHSSKDWRKYFRGTSAHNTIRVNETELSEQTGDFMFGKPYQITRHRLEEKDSRIIWEGAHDAYKKKFNVGVNRKVIWEKEKKNFEIVDTLQCEKSILVESFFHLHPDCLVEESSGHILISRENFIIGFLADSKFEMEIFSGAENPFFGWYSPGYNQIKESRTIRLKAEIDQDSEFYTMIQWNKTEGR